MKSLSYKSDSNLGYSWKLKFSLGSHWCSSLKIAFATSWLLQLKFEQLKLLTVLLIVNLFLLFCHLNWKHDVAKRMRFVPNVCFILQDTVTCRIDSRRKWLFWIQYIRRLFRESRINVITGIWLQLYVEIWQIELKISTPNILSGGYLNSAYFDITVTFCILLI